MAMRWERVRWPREVGVKRVGDIVAGLFLVGGRRLWRG